jgi:hypothetical protein
MLRFITIDPDTTGGLFIDSFGNIAYYDSENNKQQVANNTSIDRPLYLSEIFNELNNRRWGIVPRRYASGNRLRVSPLSDLNGNDDSIDFETGVYSISKAPPVEDFEINYESRLSSIYNNVISMKEKEGVTLYNSSKIVVDLVNSSIAINMLRGDEYTNTLSFIGIEKKQAKTAKVDLTVSFTKDSQVYTEDLSFKAFEYVNDNLIRENFISNINDTDVLVEYLDGIIRVIPQSSDVDECIITNCIMTYGNI